MRPASTRCSATTRKAKQIFSKAILSDVQRLRSFRGVGGAQMIRHGAKGYFVGGKIVGQGEREIKMFWSARERNLSLDAQLR